MTYLIIWRGDDSDLIYSADTPEERKAATLDIIRKRLEWRYFYGADEILAKEILETEDAQRGWQFLLNRNDHEYEGISLKETVKI